MCEDVFVQFAQYVFVAEGDRIHRPRLKYEASSMRSLRGKKEEGRGRAWAPGPAMNCCLLLGFHFVVKCGINGWSYIVVDSLSLTQASISRCSLKKRILPSLSGTANSSIFVYGLPLNPKIRHGKAGLFSTVQQQGNLKCSTQDTNELYQYGRP